MNITFGIAGDVRYALRSLARAPLVTTITILTVAVGIGATSAIFSVVDAVLLRPLPYAKPDRIVRIIENVPAKESPSHAPMRRTSMSQDEFNWWRMHSKTLSHLAMIESAHETLRTPRRTVDLTGARVSPALFPILGVSPLLGRGLLPSDDHPDADVIVISESTWRRYFAADPHVVGRTLMLGQRPSTIVGVMPLAFGSQAFWVPLFVPPAQPGGPNPYAPVIGRLRDGVSLEQANAEVNLLGGQLLGLSPEPGAPPRFEVDRELDARVAPVLPALRVLVIAVAVVLLIVCMNVANLLLARGTRRQDEFSIRRSVGATRTRITRQVLTESFVLAAAGGLAGVVLAYGGVHLLKVLASISLPRRFLPGSGPLTLGTAILPRVEQISIDPVVLAFVVGLTIVTGVLFGALPALRLSRFGEVGRTTGIQSTATASNARIGNALATIQIGFAMTLLVGAGLLLHSFFNLAAVDVGFDPRNVLSFDLTIPQAYRTEPAEQLRVAQDLRARLRKDPNVSYVGFTNYPPLQPATVFSDYFIPRGHTVDEVVKEENGLSVKQRTQTRYVSEGYLRALGARLVSGRWFEKQDSDTSALVALVSRPYAQRYFGGANPVGSTMHTLRLGSVKIVGVIDDIHLKSLDTSPESIVFLLPRQVLGALLRVQRDSGRKLYDIDRALLVSPVGGGIAFAVRTVGDPVGVLPYLRTAVRQVDPALAVDNAIPMERVLQGTTTRPRFYAVLLNVFAGVAAFIAVIGIYGVLAYLVEQRTNEIGIRMALGAERAAVLRLILQQAALMVAMGVGAGFAGAFWLSHYLSGMLFGITTLNVPTYVAVAASFTGVVLLAAYVPARRATRIDPLTAVRYE